MRKLWLVLCVCLLVSVVPTSVSGDYEYTGACCNLVPGCTTDGACVNMFITNPPYKSYKIQDPVSYPGCTVSHAYPDHNKNCILETLPTQKCGTTVKYAEYDCSGLIGTEDAHNKGCDFEYSDSCDAYYG